MAIGIAVKAEQRSGSGTSTSRRLRRGGLLPGVVYGDGKAGLSIQMDRHQFEKTMGPHLDEHMILDLEVAGVGGKKVLLQEVQYHPITHQLIHVDFHEVSMTKKLRVEMPLRLVGEPTGVTQQGGVLEHLLRVVMVECLPGDILEHVDVDVSQLSIGQSMNVGSAVKLDPAKYRVISDASIAVAAVTAPREEEAAATPAAGPAEPEVLREKKDLEGEGAEAKKDGAPAKDGAKKEAAPAAGKDAAKPAAGKEAAKPAAKEAKK